jgi:serine/threonine-protein kinase
VPIASSASSAAAGWRPSTWPRTSSTTGPWPVKVLHPELAAALGHERFLREVEIAARLQHPHILTLIDSGQADGFLYYVMPFVDGASLRARLAREHELPVADVVRIMREVADALAEATRTAWCTATSSRTTSCSAGQHAVVTDFGIAKAVSEATGVHALTSVGVTLGTPTYMAPEQAGGDPPSTIAPTSTRSVSWRTRC